MDGHDMKQVVEALQKAKNVPAEGKPTVIICQHGEGQGRQLHGKPGRLARQGAEL